MTNRKQDILHDSRGDIESFYNLLSDNVLTEHRIYPTTFLATYERKLAIISILPNDPIMNPYVTKDYTNVNETNFFDANS